MTLNGARESIRYDLRGAAHFSKRLQRDVPTPHVVRAPRNVRSPNGYGKYDSDGLLPMRMGEIRRLERMFRNQLL